MLQTIRAYATEQLDAIPELAAAARRAHAEHYTEVAVGLHQQLTFAGAQRRPVGARRTSSATCGRRGTSGSIARDVARLNDLLAPLWGYYDARGDYRSAIELGSDLLECLAATPDSPERRRDEFAVRMNVVRTELAVRGFTAEAERMIRDALDRADAAEDDRQRFPGLRSLAYLHMMRSDFERMDAVAGELMAIAEQEQDPLLLVGGAPAGRAQPGLARRSPVVARALRQGGRALRGDAVRATSTSASGRTPGSWPTSCPG